jgi:hypothetical protein
LIGLLTLSRRYSMALTNTRVMIIGDMSTDSPIKAFFPVDLSSHLTTPITHNALDILHFSGLSYPQCISRNRFS